jgi:hypothetical protein
MAAIFGVVMWRQNVSGTRTSVSGTRSGTYRGNG